MSGERAGLRSNDQLARVKLEAPVDQDGGFVLMLANGRQIASGGDSDTALARLIRTAEHA